MRIIGQIYEEENYDVFLKLEDNRDVLSGRLNKILASISEKYILNPIIVNEKKQIIDGQGRYEARKKLGLPIHYIIAPGATSEDCRRMNKYNTVWSKLDYAKSYASAGRQAYAHLLKACKITGYPISRVLRLGNHGGTNKRADMMSAFESGDLTFFESDILKVKATQNEIEEIRAALLFDGRINDAFATGVKVCMETNGYNHTRMIENCKKCRASYTQMAKLSDQLVEFERIYNKGYSAKNRLYFSDYMRNRGANVRNYAAPNVTGQYRDANVSTLK